MTKKKLPPIGENPAFRELADMLKNQKQNRIDAFTEMIENGKQVMPKTTSGQKEETRKPGEVGDND